MLTKVGTMMTSAAPAWVFLAALSAFAGPPEGVPQFAVRTLGGEEASSDTLLRSEPWVLAYVDSGASLREVVLAVLGPSMTSPLQPLPSPPGGEGQGEGRGRIVLIVRGDPAAAKKTAQRFADLKGAVWYADPTGQAARAMGVKGVPALFGVDERNIIRWRMDGPLLKPGEVRSLIEKWGAVNR